MGGFLYFIPGAQAPPTVDDLLARGLDVFADRPTLIARATVGGPGGIGGHVVAVSGTEGVGYFADRQEWHEIPGSEGSSEAAVWLGWPSDARPGPDDLIRARPLSGPTVRLGDGREWIVPNARLHTDEGGAPVPVCVLPRSIGLGADGRAVPNGISASYARLWEIGEEWWRALMEAAIPAEHVEGEAETVLTYDDGIPRAIDALAVNYRIGHAETVALGLLDPHPSGVSAILNAVVDYAGAIEIVKKNTGPGP